MCIQRLGLWLFKNTWQANYVSPNVIAFYHQSQKPVSRLKKTTNQSTLSLNYSLTYELTSDINTVHTVTILQICMNAGINFQSIRHKYNQNSVPA